MLHNTCEYNLRSMIMCCIQHESQAHSCVLAHEDGAMSGQVECAESPSGSEMSTPSEYLIFASHQPSLRLIHKQ